jgi:beta-phosphoglucomutase
MVLNGTGLAGCFDAIVTGGDVVNAKPHPDIYLKAAELLGVSPDRCIVFEDSYAGVQAGVAAGMRVVGIGTTHRELPGASLLIADFKDPALERWLGGIIAG